MLSFSPLPTESRAFWLPREANLGVDATVENIFESTSNITDSEVNELNNKTTQSSDTILGNAEVQGKLLQTLMNLNCIK